MKLRIIAFVVVAVAAAVMVQAKATAPKTAGIAPLQLREKRIANLHGKTANALGLSASQRAQLKTIRQQARLTARPVVEQLKQNRKALSAAVKTGDSARIQALSKTNGELKGQELAIRSQSQAQIYAGLTNDQRQKLDTMQTRIQKRIAARQANPPKAN